jgi:phosphopantothenoylcysteine decarboxylase / phosphopantothenate---cysteine ligase
VDRPSALEGKRILLGVSGSIAAYKAVDILRRLQEQGADVRVVLTANAERFVPRLTFETLSGHPVPDAEFQGWNPAGIGHIEVTDAVDVALVAPATANVIGKAASGIADDSLTSALIALDCPLLLAPAMNERMYRNPVVQENIARLKARGVAFVEPGTGSLACGTVGQGRLADTELIVAAVARCLTAPDLEGTTVLITAGPTREAIDAVRFISNPSTGKMGFALAAAARSRGARVILVAGPTETIPPPGVELVRVISAADMYTAVMERADQAQIMIMAAAVSDFKPSDPVERKIKKQEAPTVIHLERTEDILSRLGSLPGGRILVGFAAETDNVVENARKKLNEKNLDMIVANDVLQKGAGFASDTNSVVILSRSGEAVELPVMSKAMIAGRIIDKIVEVRKK